jgi:signal transduction histidine kinase
MLSRIPLRLRLTLAFAGVMALLLAVAGIAIRVALASALDESIDAGLRTRAAEVGALVGTADGGLARAGASGLTDAGESFAQVLGADGRVLEATLLLRDRPLLDEAELARALRGPTLIAREAVPGLDGPVRLLAVPAEDGPAPRAVVVGTSTEDRDDAVRTLSAILLIGGPVALLLASAAGYGLASAALRPVEAMRRRAAEISGAGDGARLPVPAARDEVRRLGETLNAMLERVDAAIARERAFVADAGHELRTPLAILKTELELAARGGRPAGELRAAIASAGEETDRLIRLAEALLAVVRVEEGRAALRAEPVAAGELLESAAARFAARASAAGRPIAVEPGGPARVLGDRVRLEAAIDALVDNALAHGAGTVRLAVRRSGDAVELHVLDEGPGVPPDFLPRAFERFSRADPARGRGGAGLGLAIARAVARASGGEAGLAPRPAGGLDAWLRLPAA